MTSTELVEWLEGMLEASLPAPKEERAWFLRQKPLLDRLDDTPGLTDDAFHFIHHYVSDVDVRREDPDYKRDQDEALREFLAAYRTSVGSADA